jgi:hypothetical protein
MSIGPPIQTSAFLALFKNRSGARLTKLQDIAQLRQFGRVFLLALAMG